MKRIPRCTEDYLERFWTKIEKGDIENCWFWQAGCFQSGYGQFSIVGQSFRSHRVAYFLHHGVDPLQHIVCHKCNETKCCNPHHLYLGDTKINQEQCVEDGRSRFGCRNGRSKITEKVVDKIRKSKETNVSLADQYGISDVAVSKIRNRKTWKHIA